MTRDEIQSASDTSDVEALGLEMDEFGKALWAALRAPEAGAQEKELAALAYVERLYRWLDAGGEFESISDTLAISN